MYFNKSLLKMIKVTVYIDGLTDLDIWTKLSFSNTLFHRFYLQSERTNTSFSLDRKMSIFFLVFAFSS